MSKPGKVKPGNRDNDYQFAQIRKPCCNGLNTECFYKPPLTLSNTAEHNRPVMSSGSLSMALEELDAVGPVVPARLCTTKLYRQPTRLIGTKQSLAERMFRHYSNDQADVYFAYQHSTRLREHHQQEMARR